MINLSNKESEVVPLRSFVYEEGLGLLQDVPVSELTRYLGRSDITIWLDFDQSEAAEIQRIGDLFNLHPLAVEDLIALQRRPKIDTYD
ncbi:MAG: hypothetical protein RMJ90_05720, partial [Candidatus Bipolaricaulota bacterium]|nr:hypothetical protein [Candidatus Bipolaricaulota bacterium]